MFTNTATLGFLPIPSTANYPCFHQALHNSGPTVLYERSSRVHGEPLLAKHDSNIALMHRDSASFVAEIDGSARDHKSRLESLPLRSRDTRLLPRSVHRESRLNLTQQRGDVVASCSRSVTEQHRSSISGIQWVIEIEGSDWQLRFTPKAILGFVATIRIIKIEADAIPISKQCMKITCDDVRLRHKHDGLKRALKAGLSTNDVFKLCGT